MESSYPSNKKKRVAEDSASRGGGGALVASSGTSGSALNVRPSFQTMVLEQQVSQIQAELEHERSMRELDQKRSKQAIERLQKQVELSENQAKEATSTLEDYRVTSDARIKQLQESQNQTLQKLRDSEIKLLQKEEDEDDYANESEATMVRFYKEKCDHLQSLLDQQEGSERELRKEIERLQGEIKNMEPGTPEPVTPSAEVKKLLEEAPPAILKELHRTRMNLSESQRKERQLQRKASDLEDRNHRLIREREELRIASQRLPAVQQQLDEVHGNYSKMEAESNAWQEFGRGLHNLLKIPPSAHQNPPELSALENALAEARSQVSSVATQSQSFQEERQQLQMRVESKNSEINGLESKVSELTREVTSLQKQLQQSQSDSEIAKSQMDVYKRETENLRELIKTFDNLPLASAAESRAGDILKSPKLDTSKRTLQITLNSTREELRLAQAQVQRLERDTETSASEFTRVKEKFEKLREALQAERAKAAASEQRANEAGEFSQIVKIIDRTNQLLTA